MLMYQKMIVMVQNGLKIELEKIYLELKITGSKSEIIIDDDSIKVKHGDNTLHSKLLLNLDLVN